MVKRVFCGLAVAALWLLVLKFLPFGGLFVILQVALIICLSEFYKMMKVAGYDLPVCLLSVCGVAWMCFGYFSLTGTVNLTNFQLGSCGMSLVQCPGDSMLLVGIVFLLLMRIMLDCRIKKPLETVAISVLAFFYLPFMLRYFLFLVMSSEVASSGFPGGILLAVFVAAVVKMNDAGGYFIGSATHSYYQKKTNKERSNHKLCPRISPGKSWEGLFGGILFACLTAFGFWLVAQNTQTAALALIRNIPLIHIFSIAVFLSIVGLLGDLVESLFKRAAGVKDSSGIFPAMGGFLDTFDSLIFAPAALHFYLILIVYSASLTK